MTQTTSHPTFTIPGVRLQRFIRTLGTRGAMNVTSSQRGTYKHALELDWVKDVSRDSDQIELTSAGKNVYKWIVEQDKAKAAV